MFFRVGFNDYALLALYLLLVRPALPDRPATVLTECQS